MKNNYLILGLLFISSYLQAQMPTKAWNDLGINITKALNKHDQSVDQYFDATAFLKRIIIQNPRNSEIKKFNRAIRTGWSRFSLGRTLSKQPIQYKYEFIRIHEDSSLVIRQWDEEDGANYLLFKTEYINDNWVIVDVYVLTTGEFMSQTLRNTIYLPNVIRLLQGGKDSRQGVSNAAIYIEAASLLAEQEYQRAYTKISGIPLEERLKAHQILKLNLSYYLDSDEKILKSIQEYQDRFPKDPSFEFIMLDKYVLEEEYEKALAAVDVIEDFIGEDDYLHYQKGLMHQLLKNYETAAGEMRTAIRQRPNEELYYWELIAILEWQEDYVGCIKVLKQLQKEFNYSKEILKEAALAAYNVFPYTKKFKRWVN